jgi:hypothetical protein
LTLQGRSYTPTTQEDNCPILRIPNRNYLLIRPASGANVEIIGHIRGGFGGSQSMFGWTIDGSPGQLVLNGEYQGARCGGTSMDALCDGCLFTDFEVKNAVVAFGQASYVNTTWRRMNVHHIGINDNGTRTINCSCFVAQCVHDPNQHGHCHAIYCGGPDAVGGFAPCQDNTLDQVNFWALDGSMELYGNGHVVKDSVFHDFYQAGIWHLGDGAFTAYNNVIYNGQWFGIVTGVSQGPIHIYNNTMSNFAENHCIGSIGGSPPATATNTFVRNNICVNAAQGFLAWNVNAGDRSNNLCVGSSDQCSQTASSAGFINAAGGNYRIATAGSPAVNQAQNLTNLGMFTNDADLLQRPPLPAPWTIGAYEFGGGAPEPPGPLGLVQWLKGDGNTNDSSPNGFNGTCVNCPLTNGAPLVAGQTSFVFDGVNDAVTTNNAAFRAPNFGMSVVVNTTVAPAVDFPCRIMSVGTTAVLGWGNDGIPFGYINNGPSVTGTSTILTGQNEVLGLSYDGTLLRLWRGPSGSSPPLSVGQPLSYTGSEVMADGGVTGRFCNTRAANFRYFDEAFTSASWQNIVNEVVPSGGIFTSHMRYYADAAEGSPLRPVDTDLTALPGLIFGIRVGIRNTGAQITENFPLWCQRGGVSPPIGPVKVTNLFGSLGLRIANSVFVNMGQATTVPIPDPNGLPLDTFTPIPGRFVADTINPSVQVTLPTGGETDWEWRVETGSPAVGGDFFDCAPYRENDTLFNVYNNIKRVTLQSISAPSAMRLGGVSAGGVQQ